MLSLVYFIFQNKQSVYTRTVLQRLWVIFLRSVRIEHSSLTVQIDHPAVSASGVLEDFFPPMIFMHADKSLSDDLLIAAGLIFFVAHEVQLFPLIHTVCSDIVLERYYTR